MLDSLQDLNSAYSDFETTKDKLEKVLDSYQAKMEHHKKLKKRTTVYTLFHIFDMSSNQPP